MIVSYACMVCRTKYSNKKEAAEREKKPLEPRTFKLGDRVSNIEPRMCAGPKEKPYIFKGTITKISGPEAPDYEYEIKWLGGKRERLNSHVFYYEVSYTCPNCNKKTKASYYAPELKRLQKIESPAHR